MINVTKTFLPPMSEYQTILKRAWDRDWITNRGELVLELEKKLKSYLGVEHMFIMTNGTIPIQIAIKLLGNGGEIITTPFSYVATTSSILWENCTPVFVDIDSEYLTIDDTKIEEAITDRTTCILATHVYGNPCNIEEIDRIAKKYNLSVIYDAAHCFGVRYNSKYIFEYGDISTTSFHATKLFHTGEGGAIFTKDESLYHKAYYSHNFGHNGPLDFHGLGINGKISELQAAMGLAVLPYMNKILDARRYIVEYYNAHLNFNKLRGLRLRENTEWNYSYYPLILQNEEILLSIQKKLNESEIYPRRYFYPSLNTIKYVNGKTMPISESIANRVMCLPLYMGLEEIDLGKIVHIINSELC